MMVRVRIDGDIGRVWGLKCGWVGADRGCGTCLILAGPLRGFGCGGVAGSPPMSVIASPSSVAPPMSGTRVLVVDDDAMAREVMKGYLRRLGVEAQMAHSVAEAREAIQTSPEGCFECILTDYMMPGESGLDLLDWIREEAIPVGTVVVTAAGDKQVVAEALRRGAADYLEKPLKRAQLETAVANGIGFTRERRASAKVRADAQALGQTQHQLLVRRETSRLEGIRVAHFPKFEAGGDFVTSVELGAGRRLLLVADVSGHDLRAAFVSAYFQGLARGMLEKSATVREVLALFQTILCDEWGDDLEGTGSSSTSLSVCACVVDPGQLHLSLYNAGFPVPHLVHRSGWVELLSEARGYPLGWFREPVEGVEGKGMEPGSSLVLWTDGLEDLALSLQVDCWSLVHALLRAEDRGVRHGLLASAADDILIATMALNPSLVMPVWPLIQEVRAGSDWQRIDEIQEGWQNSLLCAFPGMDPDTLGVVLLVMRESVLNALIHGCGRRGEAHASFVLGWVSVENRLVLEVRDPGPGHDFDWRAHLESEGGLTDGHRGLGLIHHLAERVAMEAGGASLRVEFKPLGENL